MLKSIARRILQKRGLLRYTTYPYMIHPAGLAYLVGCLDRTRQLPGPIVEIGCAFGWTTTFLARHLDWSNDPREYICIDTFSGFPEDQIAHEQAERGKVSEIDRRKMAAAFRDNSKAAFDEMLALNKLSARVRTIQADACKFDFSALPEASFCLIDVDLYLPVRDALAGMWPRMDEGGIIAIHDCMAGRTWDGANQAYLEFCEARGIAPQVESGIFGELSCPRQWAISGPR